MPSYINTGIQIYINIFFQKTLFALLYHTKDNNDKIYGKVKTMKPKIIDSSGNIFADLKIPNPEKALVKADVASKIHKIINKKKLNHAKVSKILQISPSNVSFLLSGHLTNFSIEQLLYFLKMLELIHQ